MIIVSNDYWKDFIDQEIGSKPIDKVEMELSAGVWTDVTDFYLGGATFDQEKERAPDKISAGDTRYTFDNTEDTFTPTDSGSIFYNIIFHGKKIKFSVGFSGLGYYPQSTMIIKDVKWDYDNQRCYIFVQELMQRLVDEEINIYPSALIPVAGAGNTGNGVCSEVFTLPFAVGSENWTLTCTTAGTDRTKTTEGLATSGTATTLVDGNANWTVNQYQNDIVYITEGTGQGQSRVISSNTATTLTVPAWTTNPDDTSTYKIFNAGVAIFSVVGSVSGNIGDALSGLEFFDNSAGIKFTISAGGVNWVAGGSPDTFTFTTFQYPEFTTENPAKIVWNLLTGYDYDTDTQSNWSARVLDLDSTQSVDNTDINYTSFTEAITNIDNNLTGYIPYDKNAALAIEEIIIHFLGSIYTDNQGRVSISAFKPSFGGILLREFADTKKVFSMNADRDTAKIINKISVFCKRSASWAWSNVDETTDDVYSTTNATSITNYGLRNPFTWKDLYWYSANRAAQEWFADRLIDKFGQPPLEIEFDTGLDAIRINLANRIEFTDERTSFSNKLLETNKIKKDFESTPKGITLTGSDTGTLGVNWLFYGSSADEGDGVSPQASSYDSATDTDKQFGYYSQTGGEGSDPEYYFF